MIPWYQQWQCPAILAIVAVVAIFALSCRFTRKRPVIPYSEINHLKPGAFMVGRALK
jgi:hypothetical protein